MTQTHENSTFHSVAPGLGMGHPPTPAWRAIDQYPLLIFVGVTGVGKSTTLDALEAHLAFRLLPNRRTLTDDLIISYLQQRDGQPVQPVTDRTQRFALTRRYRELHPGGMGHALSQLRIDADSGADGWYVFDGLRGVNEVSAACAALPRARFVLLDAPDAVRVQRLLGRGDRFDQVALDADPSLPAGAVHCFADIDLPDADALFAPDEREHLLALCTPPVGRGTVPVDELRAKLKIVVEERRNYDPTATRVALQTEAPERALVVDTTQVSATAAAAQIAAWLQ